MTAAKLHDLAVLIPDDLVAADDVRVAEPDLGAG
jgi:hypothetical protein